MNPLLSIWTEPRKTIEYLAKNYDAKTVWLLAAICGVKESFNWAASFKMGARHDVEFIYIVIFLFGPLFGILSTWVLAYFMALIGRKFGGKASEKDLRTTIVWTTLPLIVVMPLWLAAILLYGDHTFNDYMSIAKTSGGLLLFAIVWNGIKLVAIGWSFVLTLLGVAEVQGFTKWNAFANMYLAAFVTYLIFGLPLYFVFRL